jgi:hypothetical protein
MGEINPQFVEGFNWEQIRQNTFNSMIEHGVVESESALNWLTMKEERGHSF